MATKQVKVCDIFGTHEAATLRVVIEKDGERFWLSDPVDMADRAENRLIDFILRGLRPPSKAKKEEAKNDG